MLLHEIEERIQSLGLQEKIQLIQDIAEMLKPSDDDMLGRFGKVAETLEPYHQGPLEAYTAAQQLQAFLKQERV